MVTKNPGKQRLAIYDMAMHKRHKLISARLNKQLAKELGRRSLSLRKGDEVKVLRGDYKGAVGKIARVDLCARKVFVDSVKRKKASGEEIMIPLQASNMIILKADTADKKRIGKRASK